ncbi:MAG: hypothetical protein RBU27_04135, partial [Bacteroidota bacterium]|nr:hypothetical protein [Bacteroidota bacterium]
MTPAFTRIELGRQSGLVIAVFIMVVLSEVMFLHAQTPQFSYGTGTTANNIPFNPIFNNFYKHQGLYAAGLFSGAPAGYITKVYWRRAATSTATTYANAEVSLAQTTQTTFPTTHFFSPMTSCFSAGAHTIPAGGYNEWFSITLQTPFYYDPAQTLIVQFCSDGKTAGGGIPVWIGSAPSVVSPGRIWGGPGCSAPLYQYSNGSYQVFGFDIGPAHVDDAGVSTLISPVDFCAGMHPLQINVRNHGVNTINTVTIHWIYDGVPQTPVTYNTPIPGMGDAIVTLGSHIHATGVPHTVRVWTSMPNNMADTDTQNDTLEVTLIPGNPGASISVGGSPSFCAGGSVLLNANTGTGLNYQWLMDDVEISGATSSTWVATQPGSYRVIVTNATRCSDTSSATVVTIRPSPGASITAGGPTSFCAGGSVVLHANTGPGLTYQWLKDLVEISGAVSPDYVATQPGSYRVIVTNSDQCTDTSVATVLTILPSPVASITPGGPTSFCDGESVVLVANTGMDLSYRWLKDGIEIMGATSSSYTATEPGRYRVLVSNTSPCTDTSAAILVTMFPAPGASITATGPTVFCAGERVTLDANVGLGLTYEWLRDGVRISGAVLPRYTATQAGSYRVIVTNAELCKDTS